MQQLENTPQGVIVTGPTKQEDEGLGRIPLVISNGCEKSLSRSEREIFSNVQRFLPLVEMTTGKESLFPIAESGLKGAGRTILWRYYTEADSITKRVYLSHAKKQFNFPVHLIDFPDHFTENLFRVGRHLLQVLQAVHYQILHARAFLVCNAVAGAWRITQLPDDEPCIVPLALS